MDGTIIFSPAELIPPWRRRPRFLGPQAHNFVLMACIVAATFAVLLMLDQAGIQLPTAGDLLVAPRLD